MIYCKYKVKIIYITSYFPYKVLSPANTMHFQASNYAQ